jgi:Xaa-Pro dipeptidase
MSQLPPPEAILKEKYPAKVHAKKVVSYLENDLNSSSSSLSKDVLKSSILYLEGGPKMMNEDNDQESPFRQRRYFYYLTGCPLPDCRFVYDVERDHSILFIPPVDEEDVIWSGMPLDEVQGIAK